MWQHARIVQCSTLMITYGTNINIHPLVYFGGLLPRVIVFRCAAMAVAGAGAEVVNESTGAGAGAGARIDAAADSATGTVTETAIETVAVTGKGTGTGTGTGVTLGVGSTVPRRVRYITYWIIYSPSLRRYGTAWHQELQGHNKRRWYCE